MSQHHSCYISTIFVLLMSASGAVPSLAQSIERISVATSGRQTVSDSYPSDISRYGAFVTFSSNSKGLVPRDTNAESDVFVRITSKDVTRRLSVAGDGSQGLADSVGGAITPNGRFVAFATWSALVPGDLNNLLDIYVRDRLTQSVELVSITPLGVPADSRSYHPQISADGRFVAFDSESTDLVDGDSNGQRDVFIFDRRDRVAERVSVSTSGAEGNGYARDASISDNGRYIAFRSSSDNLVLGDTNAVDDIFVRDRINKVTRRVSVSAGGQQGNGDSQEAALSADGKLIAFTSNATNLVPNDTNGANDVFVSEWKTRSVERASVSSFGTQASLYGYSYQPDLSADGRFVVFDSTADNLVPGDTNATNDVFLRDRLNATTSRISVSTDNLQGNNYSVNAKISPDGRFVIFRSTASNLVPLDTNDTDDVFLRDLGPVSAAQAHGNRK